MTPPIVMTLATATVRSVRRMMYHLSRLGKLPIRENPACLQPGLPTTPKNGCRVLALFALFLDDDETYWRTAVRRGLVSERGYTVLTIQNPMRRAQRAG